MTIAAQMKATADEVGEYRKRFQAKDEAVKQLRRRKMESTDSKALIQEGSGKQVLSCLLFQIVQSCIVQCIVCSLQADRLYGAGSVEHQLAVAADLFLLCNWHIQCTYRLIQNAFC